jgi:hypothetical protein
MKRSPSYWLPRILFLLTVGLASALILLVLLSPWFDNKVTVAGGRSRVVKLFAQDKTLRRTAVASAMGLMATACVFFRPPGIPRRLLPRQTKGSPPNVAGA